MMSKEYETAHKHWLDDHLKRRKGERKRRLIKGHDHAEREMLRRVWWPAFGHFDNLHPEYEVTDFREGSRFLDFAYIRPPVRIDIEVMGYGPHQRNISRTQFCDQWVRHAHLVNDNWIIIYIGYDDIIDRPRLWQQILQQSIGKFFGESGKQAAELLGAERDIVRLAMRLGRSITLSDVKQLLDCSYPLARKLLNALEQKHWMSPDGGGSKRIHTWRLTVQNKLIPL
jgi:hypothetical protein